MADVDPPPMRAVAPVASVWCRQVDNEAESPGYTTIPDDFPGLRETLESIRIVGNLTINIADTHDYWDPGPSQSLSFYPNLFLYPAAGQRYTCVGRMFLSTEDRPRLGMKTLVFSTVDLLASGDFGGMVLRAHATMDGRGEIRRLPADPEPSVYQAIGDGFLFGKGTTEPVVVVASEQWEAAAQAVLELVGAMPAALVAQGAFLVFPYFLPAPKVNLPELAEQLPTALAVMRVGRGEASGDRHDKRMKSWEELAVTLRDLTRPPPGKKGDALPLVLQYVRGHEEEKLREISRRVDTVEIPRLTAHLGESDRSPGRDHRKEMWRIGAAMETAALLLSKPKGRSVSVGGEAGRRANEYLQARPTTPAPSAAPGEAAAAAGALPSGPTAGAGIASQHPAWLRPPPQVAVSIPESVGVPVPTGDDPSLLPGGAAPVSSGGTPPAAKPEAAARPVARVPEPLVPAPPPPVDLAAIDARVEATLKDLEGKWGLSIERRIQEAEAAGRAAIDAHLDATLREVTERWSAALEARFKEAEASARAAVDARLDARLKESAADGSSALDARLKEAADAWSGTLDARLKELEAARAAAQERTETALNVAVAKWSGALDSRLRELEAAQRASFEAATAALADRLAAVEGRPPVDVDAVARDVESRVRSSVDQRAAGLERSAAQASESAWSARFSSELKNAIEQFDARAAKSEEELRAALVAQLDVELADSREQGTALREEIEARVRKLLDERSVQTAREVHDLEQRLSVLVEGRAKDLEARLGASSAGQRDKVAAVADERIGRLEQRVALEREARLTEITEAQTEALAGLQVRMQSFVEGKLRESAEKEREQFLALLSRLKLETEQSLARAVDASHLNALLDERLGDMLERAQDDQAKAVAAAVAQSESRLRAAQQELIGRVHHLEATVPAQAVDVGHIERTVRRELDDFDRRLKVVHDHILPMVRQTWLKVSQQEMGGSLREMRQSLEKEIQRVEASMVAENDQLRERLETAVAQHGRIWLNLIHQLSREERTIVAPTPPPGRGRAGVHRAARLPPPAPAAPADGAFPPPASTPHVTHSAPPAAAAAPVERESTADAMERRRLRRSPPA